MESYIEINLKQIIENYKIIREQTKKNIIAIIKDNAYGHSLIQVGKTLSSNNVFMLGISSLNEAITLRKNMIFSPILLLGRCDEARTLYSLKITQGVSSLTHLKTLIKQNIPLSIHLEIETGMHRLGIKEEEIEETISLIKNSSIKIKGIYTHFCSEDYQKQKETFQRIIKKYFSNEKLITHCQASSYIQDDISICNTLRVGLAMYGYHLSLPVKPCLKMFCPIIRQEKVSKNTLIGYDFIEETNEDGYILTIPFGYSLGLSRLNNLCFYYPNKTMYQIGKTCMDMMMIFSYQEIMDNRYLELIGENNTSLLCSLNNENMYYILSSLSSRIKRVFI